VGDFNGDERDDVVRYSRTSGDVHVSLAGTHLGPEELWTTTFIPQNGDSTALGQARL
jgi:hypothetical protein